MKGLLLLIFMLLTPTAANADPVKITFGCDSNPCVVKFNPGGYISLFVRAALELEARNWTFIVDGPCYSACAIVADLLNKQTCITHHATFHFHKARELKKVIVAEKVTFEPVNYSDPPHSFWIHSWNKNRGGYPAEGFREMSYSEALGFWKPCNFPHTSRGLY